MSKEAKTNKKKKAKKKENVAVVEAKATLASSTAFIISAITLVAGLAWNEFFKSIFERLEPYFSDWGESVGLFLYALCVTLIAVIIIRRLRVLRDKIGGESIKK